MSMDSGPAGAFTKTMIVSVEEGFLIIITAAKEHL
jgi:hypothetical protein